MSEEHTKSKAAIFLLFGDWPRYVLDSAGLYCPESKVLLMTLHVVRSGLFFEAGVKKPATAFSVIVSEDGSETV